LVRLEGEVTLASAADLKKRLLDWLAAGTHLELDLQRVDEIDIPILQLLWAAGRESAAKGARLVGPPSEAAARAAREAGFDRLPPWRIEE